MSISFPMSRCRRLWKGLGLLSTRCKYQIRYLHQGNSVSFPVPNSTAESQGELYGELQNGKAGLVVLHEWWGLNPSIRELSAELAERGKFLTLTLDLFKGLVTSDMAEAGELMKGLDWLGAVSESQAAAKFLISQGCKKVGVVGFSMGGALSLAAVSRTSDFSAASSFYGIPASTLADLTAINVPVQCHFGELDKIEGFSSPKDTEKLRSILKKSDLGHEVYLYFASHGFVNPDSEYYNKELKEKSITRLLSFMTKHLTAEV